MPEFLEQIHWRDAWIVIEASAPGDLPPYIGSTLRGALGHLLRAALCEASNCGHDCQRPETCRYYALFERSRTPAGQNAPKPFLILPADGSPIDQIAMGGPVSHPYRSGPPHRSESIPTLSCDHRLGFDQGARLKFGIRILGPLSAALPAILDALVCHGLQVGTTPFSVVASHDGLGTRLYDRSFPAIRPQMPALQRLSPESESPRRLRIVFLTPAILKLGRAPTFDPQDIAARFFEHSLARAVQVHNALCGRTTLPWLEAPAVHYELERHRLFHYILPRVSYRQEQRLDFDGVVGYFDLAGDFAAAMPYARAAEILHFGQKSTFGLGRVRAFVLD